MFVVLYFWLQQWCWLVEGHPLAWFVPLLEVLSIFPSFSMYCVFFFSPLCLFKEPHKASLPCAISLSCADLLNSALCLVLGVSWTFGSWPQMKGAAFIPQWMPWAVWYSVAQHLSPGTCHSLMGHCPALGSSKLGWHWWGLQGGTWSVLRAVPVSGTVVVVTANQTQTFSVKAVGQLGFTHGTSHHCSKGLNFQFLPTMMNVSGPSAPAS